MLIELLNDIAVPAIGCTEPGAVALAAAVARQAVGGTPLHIKIIVDLHTFKNALAVTIPNTGGKTGVAMAGVMGALSGNPEHKLEILKDVGREEASAAEKWAAERKVQVEVDPEQLPVYIQAIVQTACGTGKAIIHGSHTNVVYIEADGNIILNRKPTIQKMESLSPAVRQLLDSGIHDIIQMVDKADSMDIDFLVEGAEMNMAVAEEGLTKRPGIAFGANLKEMVDKLSIAGNLVIDAQIFTAAAVDNRMAGSNLPVMTNSGSGNQGIATTLPILLVARRMMRSRQELARALAFGQLFAGYARAKIGTLSFVCSTAVASAIGAGVGILSFMDEGGSRFEQGVNAIVKNVIGSVAGILCCGANNACALKLGTASAVAVETAFLALQNEAAVATHGIIADSAEKSLDNLARAIKSLKGSEQSILNIMMENI